MTRGVLEPHKPDIQVQMTNCMDEPVTIYTNEQIGTCEKYYAYHLGFTAYPALNVIMLG
jgi:hypothetical protein